MYQTEMPDIKLRRVIGGPPWQNSGKRMKKMRTRMISMGGIRGG